MTAHLWHWFLTSAWPWLTAAPWHFFPSWVGIGVVVFILSWLFAEEILLSANNGFRCPSREDHLNGSFVVFAILLWPISVMMWVVVPIFLLLIWMFSWSIPTREMLGNKIWEGIKERRERKNRPSEVVPGDRR